MADQPAAVSTSTASTTVVIPTPTDTTSASVPTQPVLDPVAANEAARLAAQGLIGVRTGNSAQSEIISLDITSCWVLSSRPLPNWLGP